MANLDDKKWFVYITDHHEGPLSLREIQGRMSSGQVNSGHFVWCEGMADWKVMTEVEDFKSILTESPSTAAPLSTSPDFTVVDPIAVAHAAVEGMQQPQQTEPQVTLTSPSAEPVAAPTARTLGQISPPEARPKSRRGIRLFLATALLASVGALSITQGWVDPAALAQKLSPVLDPLVQAVPALSLFFSPIGRLEDVSPEDYEELKQAAAASPTRFAIGLSKTDALAPTLYVAGGARDGSTLDVYVVGIPDTLLNQVSFSTQIPVTLAHKIGQTAGIRDPEGKALARGEYSVILVAPPGSTDAEAITTRDKLPYEVTRVLPVDARIVGRKTVFLGGTKDAIYTARLKEFHDRMTERAAQELGELKQFQVTLTTQLTQTTGKYVSLQRGKVTSVHRKVWNGFTKQWMSLMNQLLQTTQSWQADRLDREYYYGALYKLTQDAAQSIQKIHELQNTYFTGAPESASLENQLGQSVAQAESLLLQIKNRLEAIEKTPALPGGLPARDSTT